MIKKKRLSTEELKEGILNSNKLILSRAITLTESTLANDQQQSTALIEELLPYSGGSFRLGITGVPGVGKSTFIEAFGNYLTQQGLKVAVLAIDPSSKKTKGSILGDKTRMEKLSTNPNAYIRPSAAADTLGGVANKTRETMLLCEAAGYDIIMVETVGVGQSETVVSGMVDFFLLLMLAGAGDELQGIKKGIMEMADSIAITKTDSGNEKAASKAKANYSNALHLFPPHPSGWVPKVLTTSSLTNQGIDKVWETIGQFKKISISSGWFEENRKSQKINWMHEALDWHIKNLIIQNKALHKMMKAYEQEVANNQLHSIHAAGLLIQALINHKENIE